MATGATPFEIRMEVGEIILALGMLSINLPAQLDAIGISVSKDDLLTKDARTGKEPC